jgi:transposase
MLTVDEYGRIRRAHRDGMGIRAIAKAFHHSRRKIREVLAQPEPVPYTRSKDPPAPKLGAFHGVIEAILKADEDAPRKQRHTAMQVFRRLREEYGYTGQYDAVRRHIGRRRQRQCETFIPLDHDAGQRLECDFGHIHVDFPDIRRPIPVMVAVWSYSHAPFAIALPTERTEAILAGMVEAFTFFGCVPREVWWDNPTTVATEIFKGRERKLNERYAALASHYTFEPMACMPARGNEKSHAENRVYDLQRRWATPVPSAANLDDLNAYLRRCCLKERERTVSGQTETIGQRFERDRAAAMPLPNTPFDACIHQCGKVDKYQTVHFDCNRYSVPRGQAFTTVTVKGYVDHVEVVAEEQVIARHARPYGRGQQILDPVHYLVTLGRRPAALDHSNVYRHWKLPAVFAELRQAFEQREGPHAGARQFIRVLQLLAEHPVSHVQQAIEHCRDRHCLNVEAITHQTTRITERQRARSMASHAPWEGHGSSDLPAWPPEVGQVQVPRPDLRRFDQLLVTGEPSCLEPLTEQVTEEVTEQMTAPHPEALTPCC